MSFRKRSLFVFLVITWLGSPALAQQWGIGGTYGWFNDVERRLRLQDFQSPNWEGWIETRLGEDVLVRVTYGAMKVRGDNAGQSIVVAGSSIVMPEYRDRIQYVNLGASYLFAEGPLTTGLFAGIGGYGIRPESVSPALDPFRDNRERVFGWHAGVDGALHVYRGLAVVGRLTYHGVLSQTNRSFLVASTGVLYRF